MRSRREDGPVTRPMGGSVRLRQLRSIAWANAAVSRTERLTTPSEMRLMGSERACGRRGGGPGSA
jgi:hypothetical protein